MIEAINTRVERFFQYQALRTCLWLLIVASIVTLTAGVVARFSYLYVRDDAYIFVRYADNLLAGDGLSWNADAGPTYGLTSLGHLLILLPFRILLPDNPALAAMFSSLFAGALFLVALGVLVFRALDCPDRLKLTVLAGLLFIFAFTGQNLTTHFVSGMDTMLTLTYVTAFLILAIHYERAQTRKATTMLALVGGIAFVVRPDLLILVVSIVGALILVSPQETRKQVIVIGVVIVVATVAEALIAGLYFDSLIPLPAYVKTPGYYGVTFEALHRSESAKQLYAYVYSLPALMITILIGILIKFPRWPIFASGVSKGALFALCAFIAYYLVFVIQIVPHNQRFYYPTLPILLFMATMSVILLYNEFGDRLIAREAGFHGRLAVIVTAALLFMLLPKALNEGNFLRLTYNNKQIAVFDLQRAFEQDANYWPCLDRFSRLPNDFELATTEVGLPAVMNTQRIVIDMSGLNNTRLAHDGFIADAFFRRHQPDLIYLPPAAYEKMNEEILGDPSFQAGYDLIRESVTSPRGVLGVAIRKDSQYYGSMRASLDLCLPSKVSPST